MPAITGSLYHRLLGDTVRQCTAECNARLSGATQGASPAAFSVLSVLLSPHFRMRTLCGSYSA